MSKIYFKAFLVWQVCVLGLFIALKEFSGHHGWGREDVGWVVALLFTGAVVVSLIAALCRRQGKVGALITGVLCGLIPSVVVIACVSLTQPGFEESAGGIGAAVVLAVPSGVGGAIAGIICSQPNNTSAAARNGAH